jgi:uncharacterized protein YcaQ
MADEDLDDEIEAIAKTLDESGPLERSELARRVGARSWGPQRFRAALRQAQREGRIARIDGDTYRPAPAVDRTTRS